VRICRLAPFDVAPRQAWLWVRPEGLEDRLWRRRFPTPKLRRRPRQISRRPRPLFRRAIGVVLCADSHDFFCKSERIAPHSPSLHLGLTTLQIDQYLHFVTLTAHARRGASTDARDLCLPRRKQFIPAPGAKAAPMFRCNSARVRRRRSITFQKRERDRPTLLSPEQCLGQVRRHGRSAIRDFVPRRRRHYVFLLGSYAEQSRAKRMLRERASKTPPPPTTAARPRGARDTFSYAAALCRDVQRQ
jgi:hypothetical protein